MQNIRTILCDNIFAIRIDRQRNNDVAQISKGSLKSRRIFRMSFCLLMEFTYIFHILTKCHRWKWQPKRRAGYWEGRTTMFSESSYFSTNWASLYLATIIKGMNGISFGQEMSIMCSTYHQSREKSIFPFVFLGSFN